jgi:hypothetical protein
MGIGTSMGAYYEDEFHMAAAQWDPKYDDNEITPDQMGTNQQLEQVEQTELGGIPVGMKSQMPFPDNRNPDTDFVNRFPKDMKSGILNDLKPKQDTVPPLIRKINDSTTPEEFTRDIRKEGYGRIDPEWPPMKEFLKNLPDDIERIDHESGPMLRLKQKKQEDLTS